MFDFVSTAQLGDWLVSICFPFLPAIHFVGSSKIISKTDLPIFLATSPVKQQGRVYSRPLTSTGMLWKERFRHARLGRAFSSVFPEEITSFVRDSSLSSQIVFLVFVFHIIF